jgi:hypothetical protein
MFQCSGMVSWTVFLAVFYYFWVTSLFGSQCYQVSLLYFLCVGVMYSGEYDVCDVILCVYIHTGQAEKFA